MSHVMLNNSTASTTLDLPQNNKKQTPSPLLPVQTRSDTGQISFICTTSYPSTLPPFTEDEEHRFFILVPPTHFACDFLGLVDATKCDGRVNGRARQASSTWATSPSYEEAAQASPETTANKAFPQKQSQARNPCLPGSRTTHGQAIFALDGIDLPSTPQSPEGENQSRAESRGGS